MWLSVWLISFNTVWDWETQGLREVELLLVKKVRGQLFLNRPRNPQSITQTYTQTETHARIQMHAQMYTKESTESITSWYIFLFWAEVLHAKEKRIQFLSRLWIDNQSRTNGRNSVCKQLSTTQTVASSDPSAIKTFLWVLYHFLLTHFSCCCCIETGQVDVWIS